MDNIQFDIKIEQNRANMQKKAENGFAERVFDLWERSLRSPSLTSHEFWIVMKDESQDIHFIKTLMKYIKRAYPDLKFRMKYGYSDLRDIFVYTRIGEITWYEKLFGWKTI